MRIVRIETMEGLDAERERWERLERQDPRASVFTSWRWLRSYLPVAKRRWFVLVAREGDDAVAYLPLSRNRDPFDRELYFGANPHADYCGMIALPSREDAVIEAFAAAIVAEPWDGFNACDCEDERLDRVVARLREGGLRLEVQPETTCRSTELPASWDEYCTAKISAKTRVNLLRVERRLADALPGFRITEPTAATLDAHVDAIIDVNHARWGGSIASARRRYGGLFRSAFAHGILRMFVYWDGEKPIAGGAAFVDELRSSLGLYMIGFDEAYDRYSPGRGIVGRAIRSAIEGGFRRFDFLRGEEPFKARYADEVRTIRHYRLTRPGLRSAAIAFTRPRLAALKLQLASIIYGGRRTA